MENSSANLLEALAALSREFGTGDYVKAGGGNSSAKTAETIYVKPSGINMRDARAQDFVAIDRAKLASLYAATPPDEADPRERLVKELTLAAVRKESPGRPSVEAPLHDSFQATFVMHTHPATVNGMTCARDGRSACAKLFGDAMWIEYTDPGYVLAMRLRQRLGEYVSQRGREPAAVFLQNHGLIVAEDTPDDIRRTHKTIKERIEDFYGRAGVRTELRIGPMPSKDTVDAVSARLREALGHDAAHIRASGPFAVAGGPISPDHVVYARARALVGEATARDVKTFRGRHGYAPRVIACSAGVFAVGATGKSAAAAMELAMDAALVEQLAQAFGGIRYMDQRAVNFIDNWEVEAYRRSRTSS